MSEKLEELISLLYQDRLTQCGKRLLVENIEKLQKENKKLKDKLNISKIGSDYWCMKYGELQKENEELKELMAHKNGYTKLLEEDLFENCENFVISKDRIKEQIKRYAKLSDDFYSKWKELSLLDEDYKKNRDKGMCCDAIVNALQELLKG